MSELQDEVNKALEPMRRIWAKFARRLTRTRQKVYMLEAGVRLRALGKQPRLPLEFTSQFGEDLLAWDLFNGKTEGFFIEAGAFDGYHYSATYALEAIGWKG